MYEQQRGSPTARGYDSRWRKAREGYLRKHPLCECDECQRLGRIVASAVVDHIVPHRLTEALSTGDADQIAYARARFWDSENNWCAMSKRCHDRKTSAVDGGFGNRRRDLKPQNSSGGTPTPGREGKRSI